MTTERGETTGSKRRPTARNAPSGSGAAPGMEDLRAATERLSDQVATLATALETVNHLQERQQEIDVQLTNTAAAAEEQRELANHLIGTLGEKAPQAEVLQMRGRARVLLALIALVIVVLILGVLGLAMENGRVDRSIRQACLDRLSSLQLARAREAELAKVDYVPTRPAHLASVRALDRIMPHC